jgi:hypothetical protein
MNELRKWMRLVESAALDWSPGGGSKEVTVGATTITYGVAADGQTAEVILVQTPRSARGNGSARRAMEHFLRSADEHQITLFLNADPMDKGIRKPRLDAFYRSLGFVKNMGRKKDFRSRAEFVRSPKRLVESDAGQVLYHVTPVQNLRKIMQDGLVPKRGVRSRKLGEIAPAIYLFPSLDDVESAIQGWMGNEFSDEARLALLAVTVPPNIQVQSVVGYERAITVSIPPDQIRVLTRDLLGEINLDHLR